MALEVIRKGRPNKNEQISMREKIIECYEKNISATTASRETGYNIKTVCKYYDDISKTIFESQNIDFIHRRNMQTAQLISSYERLILKLQSVLDNALDEMSKTSQENKPLPKNLIGDLTRITSYIAELNEKKYNYSIDMSTKNSTILEDYDNEDLIKKIARHLILDSSSTIHHDYTEREIIQRIITLTKCDVMQATSIFGKMMELGLGVCSHDIHDFKFGEKYFLLPFALTREYISNDEWNDMRESAKEEEMEIVKESEIEN